MLNPMNHNVSLVRNDKGEEVIVIGKGIAFGKKKGDLIAENQVEKIFRMKTEESSCDSLPFSTSERICSGKESKR
ncbi:hypothetical protein K8353_50820, partial [Burkholderia contaminans]|nr:hypothetical protein [Burkholderia contaminans]